MSNLNKEIGNLLKKFRKNENLSQKDLATGIVSRSTYTRIESGETQIGANDLMQMLDRLNLNYVEFFYSIKQDRTEKRLITEESQRLGSNPNTTKSDLENFYKKNIKLFNQSKDMFYYFSAIFAKVLLNDVTKDELDFIYNYINDKEIYTFFDFSLLANVIIFMESYRVYHLTNKMLPQLRNVDPDSVTYKKLNLFFINLINLGLANNDKEQTFKFLKSAKIHNENFPDYLMEIKLLYFESLASFRYSNSAEELTKCYTYISIFKETGYGNLAKECLNDITLYIKYKNKPVPLYEFSPVHTKHT